MRVLRLTLALGLALGASLLVSAAFADDPVAAPAPPTQVASLPAAPAPPATADAPKATTPDLKPEGKHLALAYPVPTTASAADLLRAADDYAFYADYASFRRYLEQVISAYPDTREAGRALVLLADQYASRGDQAQADALSAQLPAYPETQAFASLIHTVNPAEKAKQYSVSEQAYLAYLSAWPGTDSADWAALRLGDLYRFDLEDNAKAIALFQDLITQHQTDPVAEEALVSLAETLNWSETGRQEEAHSYYQQALDTARTPGLQVRALFGLGDMLLQEGELPAASDLFSQIISAYPTHPSAALAYAKRSMVAEKQNNWEQTLADAKAFLTYPSTASFQKARAHWILAKDAFRNNRLDEAEAEFTLLASLAETTRHNVEFRGESQAGLAYCAQARGRPREAMQFFQAAAEVEIYPQKKAFYLYQAAELARLLGDDVTRNAILARMTAEMPGSPLTTKLVGHEVLPAPEI
jgi:tetratricopeptide (TPR) repeat protein